MDVGYTRTVAEAPGTIGLRRGGYQVVGSAWRRLIGASSERFSRAASRCPASAGVMPDGGDLSPRPTERPVPTPPGDEGRPMRLMPPDVQAHRCERRAAFTGVQRITCR